MAFEHVEPEGHRVKVLVHSMDEVRIIQTYTNEHTKPENRLLGGEMCSFGTT